MRNAGPDPAACAALIAILRNNIVRTLYILHVSSQDKTAGITLFAKRSRANFARRERCHRRPTGITAQAYCAAQAVIRLYASTDPSPVTSSYPGPVLNPTGAAVHMV